LICHCIIIFYFPKISKSNLSACENTIDLVVFLNFLSQKGKNFDHF